MDDRFQMKPLRSDQRKALAQIEPHLAPEDGDRPDARSVVFARAVVERVLHQVEVLLHFRSRPFTCLRLAPVICHMAYAICHMPYFIGHMELVDRVWLVTQSA